ncbi:hypothetical protein DR88_5239 [Klebsiella pneumoniae]|nr:hypothetical protein DR88_5239 [Klebsiella pneumoniae]
MQSIQIACLAQCRWQMHLQKIAGGFRVCQKLFEQRIMCSWSRFHDGILPYSGESLLFGIKTALSGEND